MVKMKTMNKEISAVSATQHTIASALLVISTIALAKYIPPESAADNLVYVHYDIAITFIIGALAMLMKNGLRKIMYFGMIIGFGIMFMLHRELMSIGAGLCTFFWGIGMAENRERQCGALILGTCMVTILGYLADAPTLYGYIEDFSREMNPLVVMMFVMISLYMIRKK